MRFMIEREGYYDDKKPLGRAYRSTYTRIDRRTTDDPAKVPAFRGKTDWWYGSGENHRVVNGEIVRDFPNTDAWFLDIETLDDLVALVETFGEANIEIPDTCAELRIKV